MLNTEANKLRLNVGKLQSLKLALQEEELEVEDLAELLEVVTMLEQACLCDTEVDQNLLLALFFMERAKVTAVDRLEGATVRGCDIASRADDAAAAKIKAGVVDVKNQIRLARIGRGLRVPNGPRK